MISTLFKKLVYVGFWLSLRAGTLVLKISPRRFSFFFFDFIAGLGFYLFHGFRKRSGKNLRLALGEQLKPLEINEIVQNSLKNFFRDIVEMGIVFNASREENCAEISLMGQEHLAAALARGKGVIVLSAHLGNFFLVGTRLAFEGYPTSVLLNVRQGGHVLHLMDDYLGKIGQKAIHAKPRPQALRQLVRVLRGNELAVVIADEYRSGEGIRVPFFGHTVLARRGPATLALRTGAAVLPIYLIRQENRRLKLIIEPEIEILRSGRIQEDVEENTLRITRWLERTVRSYPDQWNWMNIHWQPASPSTSLKKDHAYKRLA
ncbi:MAG: lysophospholipid acyltransferase family protein [Candidatus Binatia bacterium]